MTTATAHVEVLLGAMSGAFNVAVAELAVDRSGPGNGAGSLPGGLRPDRPRISSGYGGSMSGWLNPGRCEVISGDTPEAHAPGRRQAR